MADKPCPKCGKAQPQPLSIRMVNGGPVTNCVKYGQEIFVDFFAYISEGNEQAGRPNLTASE
jgi:hypothetical protein